MALNGVLEHLWPHLSDSIAKSLAKDLEPSIKLALSKVAVAFEQVCGERNVTLRNQGIKNLGTSSILVQFE